MAYEPDHLGEYKVMGVDTARGMSSPRVYIGSLTIEYMDIDETDRVYAFPNEVRESIVLATPEYAEILRERGRETLADFAVSKGRKGSRLRSYVATDASRYLGVKENDMLRMEYGERGKYAIARISRRTDRELSDLQDAVQSLFESDVFTLDDRGWHPTGRAKLTDPADPAKTTDDYEGEL